MQKIKATIAALLLTAPFAAQSAIIEYSFEQLGFDEGASVSGMFAGEDLDGNGQLSSFAGEVSGFMMSFSGNSLVDAFDLGIDALFGLVYDLDGGPLGDGFSLDVEGIGASGGPYQYSAGPGPFDVCGAGVECAFVFDGITGGASFSGELISVGVKVPEPGTLALLGLGLAGFGMARRKQAI